MPAFASTQNEPFFSGHSDVPSYSRITVWGASNTTVFDLSSKVSLKNIVAYRDLDLQDLTDLDGVSRFTVGVPAAAVGGQCGLIPGVGPLMTLRGSLCNLPLQFDSNQFTSTQRIKALTPSTTRVPIGRISPAARISPCPHGDAISTARSTTRPVSACITARVSRKPTWAILARTASRSDISSGSEAQL